jgi:phytoene dehydrogenase-like protein
MTDAVVVGAGPNGLAAAITLAEAGCDVLLVEGADTVGGGARTAELTLPGFRHDVCSAVHPLGVASPFFRDRSLVDHGLAWLHPEVPLAHPFDDGTAAVAVRSVADTAAGLGADADAYRRLFGPLVRDADAIGAQVLGPLLLRPPRHPLAALRFGRSALRSATGLASARFATRDARALFAGLAGHRMMSLHSPASAAPGVVLGMLLHQVGWPVPRGGTQAIPDALARYFETLGGKIETGRWVRSMAELPPARAVLLDVTPRQLLQLAGGRLPGRYRRALARYRHGSGAFKVDYALDGPVPWRADGCARAGVVHLGGTLEEVAAAEAEVHAGRHPERPFVLVAQPGVVDDSRAPAGKHPLWAYCHVPHASTVDMTEAITAQIERFAPGFRDRVLATATHGCADLEAYNPNYIGGDIAGGAVTLRQLVARPVARLVPHRTPDPDLYLCSASTPPGPGVHGMCGVWAARAALRRLR